MSKFDNRPKKNIEQGKNIFFATIPEPKQVEGKNPDIDYDEKIRQTYYVTQQQKRALALMAAHEDMDISEIIRAALDAYIPQNYVRMVYMK